ncbi:hypothetical protein [Polyangium jinanense]|uniref:Uncharacterized protein n=1 Tax=Polyangium jinanense TaxID=2829994 RepID=A0A9X3X2T0_9BACT|nr:hypothetical protein [Polyangium jinanense]MDC3954992.1 hypothetical protein [Polyangium jinanense]MDC3981238.1 hypothetical protein [Polyangium jinanense]
MAASPRASLLLRMATVTLSLGVLGVLVTQASLSTGCSRSEPPAASAVPEPRAAVPPPAPSAAPAASAVAPEFTGSLDVGDEMFGTTKSGKMFRPSSQASAALKGESGILQNVPPSNNAAPSKAHAPR